MTRQIMLDNVMDMEWGFFSTAHIVTLILAIAINIGLYLYLRKRSRQKQIGLLLVLSFTGIASIVYDLFVYGSPWEHLPLDLFSLTALILPIAVLFRRKWSCNLLLLWSLGSCLLLVANADMASEKLLSLGFIFYYFPLVFQAGIPILLFALDLVERDPKTIRSTLLISAITYTVVHFINVAINSAGLLDPAGNAITVNYLFTVTPENYMLNLFWTLIPYEYWYLCLSLPMILIYLGWWYLPELLEASKRRRRLCKKLRAVDKYYNEYYDEYVEEIIEHDD